MRPKLPSHLVKKLRVSGQPAPWLCKLHLRHGRTVYAVEINARGEIAKVDGRAVFAASDIGFSVVVIEDLSID